MRFTKHILVVMSGAVFAAGLLALRTARADGASHVDEQIDAEVKTESEGPCTGKVPICAELQAFLHGGLPRLSPGSVRFTLGPLHDTRDASEDLGYLVILAQRSGAARRLGFFILRPSDDDEARETRAYLDGLKRGAADRRSSADRYIRSVLNGGTIPLFDCRATRRTLFFDVRDSQGRLLHTNAVRQNGETLYWLQIIPGERPAVRLAAAPLPLVP